MTSEELHGVMEIIDVMAEEIKDFKDTVAVKFGERTTLKVAGELYDCGCGENQFVELGNGQYLCPNCRSRLSNKPIAE